jgi:hypothetical protein
MSSPAERLEAAIDDLQRFRDEWERLECPSMIEGSMRSMVAHPLIKMIRDAETAIVKLSSPAAAKSKGGRPPGAQSSPDRRTKLKVVNS